mgnify:CR=1 FL=1
MREMRINSLFLQPTAEDDFKDGNWCSFLCYLLGSEHLRLNHWRLSLLTVLLFIHFLLDTELHGYTDSFFCSVNSVPFVPEKCGLDFYLVYYLPVKQVDGSSRIARIMLGVCNHYDGCSFLVQFSQQFHHFLAIL